MIERVCIIQYPPRRDENSDPIPVFYVETREEERLYRDPPGEHSANSILMGSVIVVASPEQWAKLLLLAAAGHAEIWRLYNNRNMLADIFQPEGLADGWHEVRGAEHIAAALNHRDSQRQARYTQTRR